MNDIKLNSIQFKRVLNYNGSVNDAINCLQTKLNPSLSPGEPIIVSYLDTDDNNSRKYFLSIGVNSETKELKVFPAFNSIDDFIKYVNKVIVPSSGGINENNISSKSEILVSKDEKGYFILKLKASIINANNVNYTYLNNETGEYITITQEGFNNQINSDITSIKEKIKWKLL